MQPDGDLPCPKPARQAPQTPFVLRGGQAEGGLRAEGVGQVPLQALGGAVVQRQRWRVMQ